MTAAKKILGAAIGDDAPKLYVDDVFSTYLYTGNGFTQTINNGIDLAGEGGLVWRRSRTFDTANFGDHILIDTDRKVSGTNQILKTNTTDAQLSAPASNRNIMFLSSGYLDRVAWPSGTDMISWTFRRAPKFFDVVTYTGNGSTNRNIAHSLGVAPGMIVVKSLNVTGDWCVYHRSAVDGSNNVGWGRLNATGEFFFNGVIWDNIHPTSSTFHVSNGNNGLNVIGSTYVAYLFAHDPSADGIIQCGSFTTGSIGTVTDVNLGWEPQFLLWRPPNDADSWRIIDSMRGFSETSYSSLQPNTSNAEIQFNFTNINRGISPTATGFKGTAGQSFGANKTIIYLAIRRPNKPPTTGTEVYNAITRTGTGAAATVTGVGFAPDLVISKAREAAVSGGHIFDKLRGVNKGLPLANSGTGAEKGDTDDLVAWGMDGVNLGEDTGYAINKNPYLWVNHFFRRAPGVFNVVCYTGTGVARTVPHNLGVAPELMIMKQRNAPQGWSVWCRYVNGGNAYAQLNATDNFYLGAGVFYGNGAVYVEPTNSIMNLGTSVRVNGNAATYVAYLFATLPGISKVGSYTGNGSSQTINCGFTTGARFILIKRTDSSGDWYIWDTARGIIAANDPHLSLNTTAAEVTTDDSVDPYTAGFIVNQNTATNVNVNDGQYIFLAIA